MIKQAIYVLSYFLFSNISLHGMWYVVDPAHQSECLNGNLKGNVIQRYMLRILDAEKTQDISNEMELVRSYCKTYSKKDSSGKCYVPCPEKDCDIELTTSRGGVGALVSALKLHWYTTVRHQPDFHAHASGMVVQNKKEARELYNNKSIVEVIAFPEFNAQPLKKNKVQEQKKLSALIAMPQQVKATPLQFYLMEPTDVLGAFCVFRAESFEKVIEDYLKSKQLRNQAVELKDLQNELLHLTKKQQLVQGDTISTLVCPWPKCNYQHIEYGDQPLLAKIVSVLVIHYAAHHKHDNFQIKKIIDLIATDIDTARIKMGKGI